MKHLLKAGLFSVLFSSVVSLANAQIFVRVRPTRPTVVVKKTPAPAAGYVWVDDEWTARGRVYEYKGGYWQAPPRPNAVYQKGYWKRNKKGWHWVPGRWK